MATDFDFDGTFDEENNPPNTAQAEQQPVVVEEEEEEQPARSRNLLRIILLVLLILALLCSVCFFASSRLGFGIPGVPGFGAAPPPPEPTPAEATDAAAPTEEAAPTDAAQVPAPETAEPGPGEEVPVGTEEAVEDEFPAPEEQPLPDTTEEPAAEPPIEEDLPPEEATPELVEEPFEEPAEGDLEATLTATPVPGPTATTGATDITTPESCEANTPPAAEANGPYEAMLGKGQAFITLDASGSSDSEGNITEYAWDFGDGTEPQSSQTATTVHGYTAQGVYEITLTVTDACGASAQDTAEVSIVGPTPPADEDASDEDASSDEGASEDSGSDAEEAAAPSTGAAATTLGFCYRVQRGDTLSGLAAYYGLSTADLARVNNVNPNYFVVAGESLFVPGEPVKRGPNGYRVEAGDTFYSISYQCDIPVTYLAQVNDSTADASLTPGQIVILPLSR